MTEAVFDKHLFGDRLITVIGAGAIGSKVVNHLARRKLSNIEVWDPDVIDTRNPQNQLYGIQHIGQYKVDVLQELVFANTGIQIQVQRENHNGRQPLGQVVFMLPDCMKARDRIFREGIEFNPHVEIMLETRMGPNRGRVYLVDPNNEVHIKCWKQVVNPDKDFDAGACGRPEPVGETASIIAGYVCWQFINWWAVECNQTRELCNELLFYFDEILLEKRIFKKEDLELTARD